MPEQNSDPQGFKKRICAFPCPLTESLEENKRMSVKWALFAYPFLLVELKTLRCPIFSVPMLALGVVFLKVHIRNHHPHRTKSKQNLTVESGLWLLNISPFYSFLMFSDPFFGFPQSAHSLHR